MCRNISNMLFVLFAVVLSLPASKGEGSEISHSESLACYLAVKTGGDIFCQLYGYDKFDGLTYGTCQLGCDHQNVQLPKEACSNGVHNPCTREELDRLQKWANTLENQKAKIKEKWCKA
uniref:Putative secreted protein n=1 Tax=Ixodes ricinus TaxID=34613 RepID=V5HAY4_IXORI